MATAGRVDQALTGWERQLREQVAPYLQAARDRSHAMQVVLYISTDGKLGRPKITVTTEDT